MIQSSEQHLKHMGIHEAALESHIFGIVGVLKQIVSCELFILIASEISLNDQVPRESKPAELAETCQLHFHKELPEYIIRTRSMASLSSSVT